jgi:hypothetical protein
VQKWGNLSNKLVSGRFGELSGNFRWRANKLIAIAPLRYLMLKQNSVVYALMSVVCGTAVLATAHPVLAESVGLGCAQPTNLHSAGSRFPEM